MTLWSCIFIKNIHVNYLKNKKVVCDWTTRNVLKLKKKMRNKPKQSRLYDVPWNFPNQPRLNEHVINSGRLHLHPIRIICIHSFTWHCQQNIIYLQISLIRYYQTFISTNASLKYKIMHRSVYILCRSQSRTGQHAELSTDKQLTAVSPFRWLDCCQQLM